MEELIPAKFLVLLLLLTLLLPAFTGPNALQKGGLPEAAPYPGRNPTINYPTAYPIPQVTYPTSTLMTYAEPSPTKTTLPSLAGSSYEPQQGDENLPRDIVFLDLTKSHVALSASDISQTSVILQGKLPDARHKLRVAVSAPEANLTINLEAYSVVDPASTCLAQLEPFTTSIQLGSYPTGQYVVNVNGEKLGEFSTSYAAQPGDDLLGRGEVSVDMASSQLLKIGTQPVQAIAILRGNSLTPCNPIRLAITRSNENSAINLEIYSLINPKQNCIAVLQSFEIAIIVDTDMSGHYSIYVNGKLLREFDG